jgi:hypothetical protein
MSARDVRIRFDPVARRWWVAADDDPAGELVVDGVRPDPGALAAITDAFGQSTADRVRTLAAGDPDEVVDLTIAAAARTALDPVEPGVLTPVGPSRWTVTTEIGPAEVEVTPGLVRVMVVGVVTAGLWVRISTGRSGSLVAVGALTRRGDDLETSIAMGLELDMTDVVITVTVDPLADIGNRWARAEARFDDLMASARTLARRHPRRAARLADRAAPLADVLGDSTRSTMASDLAGTWRRRSVLRWVAGGAAIVAAAAITLALGDGSDSGTTDQGATTVPDTTPVVTWTSADGDPGPSTFTFADGSGVMIAVESAEPVVRPGDTWTVGLRVTSREVGVFDDTGDRERATERCRLGTPIEITAGALNPGMFSLRLTRTDGNGGTGGSIVAGQVPFNPQTDPIAAVPNTCGEFSVIDGRVLAEHSVIRAGQSAGFTLGADATPGLWDVAIDMGGQPVESMVGRVRLVVLPDE